MAATPTPGSTATLYVGDQVIGNVEGTAVALVETLEQQAGVPRPENVHVIRSTEARTEMEVDLPRAMMRKLFGPLRSILSGEIAEIIAANNRSMWNRPTTEATPGVILMYAMRRERNLEEQYREMKPRRFNRNGTPLRNH